MRLILSKYPKAKETDHGGESSLEFQTGTRTLDYGDLEDNFDEHLEEHGEEDETLILGSDYPERKDGGGGLTIHETDKEAYSKYPNRKTLTHTGDSEIIYERGVRVTDIDKLEEAFDDFVEENEGKADAPMVMYTTDEPGVKKVPKTDGTYPDELNYDKKVLSTNNVNVELFRPKVFDLLLTIRLIKDPKLKEQLFAMIFNSEQWLSEICDGLSNYKEHVL